VEATIMNWIRTHWSKISTAMLVTTMLGVGAVAATSYFANDCCAMGAACCKPGAACCRGGMKVAQHEAPGFRYASLAR
jgi:hypothetical protein